MSVVFDRPRVADRTWHEEFDELDKRGFVWHFDRNDWESARANVCICCGEEMDFRGFELRDISYRAYALCAMCGWWMEF